MTTDQKGAIAETAIVHAATKLHIPVLKPIGKPERYDLVFALPGERHLRVQCKWGDLKGSIVVVRCCSNRRARAGVVRRSYGPDEIDAFAAYCGELDRCFLLPLPLFARGACIHLRLTPPLNNQHVGVNWADDFDFERLDWARLGP